MNKHILLLDQDLHDAEVALALDPCDAAFARLRDVQSRVEQYARERANSEQTILGSFLINNEYFTLLGGGLDREDFVTSLHRHIFQTIRELIRSGKIANPITVRDYGFPRRQLGIDYGKYLASLAGCCDFRNFEMAFRNISQLTPEDHFDIAHLYWETDISVKEIMEAYNIPHIHRMTEIAGRGSLSKPCGRCFCNIFVHSRSEAARDPKFCQNCSNIIRSDRYQKYQSIESETKQRQNALRKMPYREYLLTPEWQATRKSALKRAGFKCQVCCSDGLLNVHHRTYERRGAELPRDLTVLCTKCHKLFHESATLAESGRGDKISAESH